MSFDQKRLLFLDLSVSLIVQMISFSWLFFSINFSVFFFCYLCERIYRVQIHMLMSKSIFAMLFY